MPVGVISIEKLADGVRITKADATVVTVTSADVPKNSTIASAQTFINNFIQNKGWFSQCRVNSLSPFLDVDIAIGDQPLPSNFQFGR